MSCQAYSQISESLTFVSPCQILSFIGSLIFINLFQFQVFEQQKILLIWLKEEQLIRV